MILIIKHIDIEGPGTLGDFFKSQGQEFQIVELGAGDPLPADPHAYKAVVVLGGPMNVDEEDKYPFLKPENEFIRKVLEAEIPFLGICLGSQLLAKAAGAKVIQSPVKEIGWYHIRLTPEGQRDPLFKGFNAQDPVYHWHGDMFQIPDRGQLLATAQGCPHQALKVGPNAYGLQFHVEVTDRSIKEWCGEYCRTDLPGRAGHAQSMLDDYWKYKKAFDLQAQGLYRNFLEIIHDKAGARSN
ncbi:MAG: type 1 glutamine amidotransferase [Candidatus Omnitrophica bacterium]|nr:type 1 glutamine amidotransferase [Candidatus Omnitrophota bacterium]